MKHLILILSCLTLSLSSFGENDTLVNKSVTGLWELSYPPEGFQSTLFTMPAYFRFDSTGTYLSLNAFKDCDSNKLKYLKKQYGNVYQLNGDTTKENTYLVNTAYNRNLRPIWCGFFPKWTYNAVSKELKINTVQWFSTQKHNAPVYSNPIMMDKYPKEVDCFITNKSFKVLLLTATELIVERKLGKKKSIYHYKKSTGHLNLPAPKMIKATRIPRLVQPTVK